MKKNLNKLAKKNQLGKQKMMISKKKSGKLLIEIIISLKIVTRQYLEQTFYFNFK